MPIDILSTEAETGGQRLERLLTRGTLDGLKAILNQLCADRASLHASVLTSNTFGELLARLGFKLVLTKQIHVQDAYSRMGQEGGIKVVLPYYDIPTQSSFPTLVNFDSTFTMTPKGEAFFGEQLNELRKGLTARA